MENLFACSSRHRDDFDGHEFIKIKKAWMDGMNFVTSQWVKVCWKCLKIVDRVSLMSFTESK